MTEFSNYWETTVNRTEPTQDFEFPEHCDVLIVGGGFNGVSTAFHLARRGVKVVLLEEHVIGWGASGRNGGMALTGLKESFGTLIQKYGLGTAKEQYSASLEAVELVRGLIKKERLAVDMVETGHIETASKKSHFDGFLSEQKLLDEHLGHRVGIFSADELRGELRTDNYYGGIFDPQSVSLNPLQYVTELARAARGYGAIMLEGVAVLKIWSEGGTTKVITTKGEITSDRLVLSSSAYSDMRLAPLQKTHIKIGSYVLATEPLPFDGKELIKNDRSIYDTLNFLSYYRVTADNRMLFGGRAVFAPESDANIRDSARILREMMLHVFPELDQLKIDHVWGGTLDVTLNKMPSFTEKRSTIFSVGFAGHGISIATYFGMRIAEKILGSKDRSVFEVPFTRNVPFWTLRNAYLPFVEKYYRFLDNIN